MIKFFLALVSLSVLFSCEKDEPISSGHGSVELIFKARYGAQALVQGVEYDYFGHGTILFGTTDLYYNSLRLVNAKDSVLIKDVDYLSIMSHHTTTASAEEGLKIIYNNVPVGDYHGIDLNIGLTASQNKTKPVSYPLSHPLGDGTRYWSGWDSYIFSKTEGTFKNGTDYYFTYHAGFDDAMRSLHFNKNIIIKDKETTRIEILIDYKKMFEAGDTPIDIPSNPQIHNTSAVMTAFVDRYQLAFSIK